MKNFTLIIAALLFFSQGFCQDISPEKTASDLRQMSESQQIGGIILLAAGVTTLAIASQGDISFDDLPTVIILGSLATLGGTALLIASGKNKKKSQVLSANLSLKKPFFEDADYAQSKPIPTISLKMRF